MPGTLVRDSLAANLATGATLTSAGATNGTAVEINKPGDISVFVTYPTPTGTTPTLLINIQGADDSGFTTNVTGLGSLPVSSGSAASQAGLVRVLRTRCDKRYIRAQVTLGGTSPVYTGLTIVPRTDNDRNTPATDTAG